MRLIPNLELRDSMKNTKLCNSNAASVNEVVIAADHLGTLHDFFLVQLNMIALVCIGTITYEDEGLYTNICYMVINI